MQWQPERFWYPSHIKKSVHDTEVCSTGIAWHWKFLFRKEGLPHPSEELQREAVDCGETRQEKLSRCNAMDGQTTLRHLVKIIYSIKRNQVLSCWDRANHFHKAKPWMWNPLQGNAFSHQMSWLLTAVLDTALRRYCHPQPSKLAVCSETTAHTAKPHCRRTLWRCSAKPCDSSREQWSGEGTRGWASLGHSLCSSTWGAAGYRPSAAPWASTDTK